MKRWRIRLLYMLLAVALGGWAYEVGWLYLSARRNQALLAAVTSGDAWQVRLLLRLGADPNARDRNGLPALCLAAKAPEIHGPIVMYSVGGHGVCRSVKSHRGYSEIVPALVAAGAKVNVADARGDTPLQQASRFNEWYVVEALKKAGAKR